MRVEIDHGIGVRWREHEAPGETLAEAAYAAVRESCPFLTDENHTYDAGPHETEWGGKPIRFNSVRIYRGPGAPPYSGPPALATDYWFAMEYREPKAEQGAP